MTQAAPTTTIAGIRAAMAAFAAAFDPALLAAADAARVLDDAAAIENMAAVVKALAATRVAETELWRRDGDRSAAHQLARRTGTSVGRAARALETARRLQGLPATAEAARRGELSFEQAAAVAGGACADPGAEARLLERARRAPLAELRREAARVRAAADPDPEARRRRIHAGRYLRHYCDDEGAWHLEARDNPEVGAQIMAALAPLRDEAFRRARAEGRREPLEAYAMDALAALAARAGGGGVGAGVGGGRGDGADGGRGAGGGSEGGTGRAAGSGAETGPPGGSAPDGAGGAGGSGGGRVPGGSRVRLVPKILVRVDLDALLRGYPVGDETVELVGYGPVAVSAIRDMIDTGDPFLAAIATRGADVVGVAHLGRRPSAHQGTALEWLYPTCAAAGCDQLAFLEADHRVPWAATRFTLLGLLDRLCPHHHDLKTREGWALVAGRGKRPMVPPGHPRHPGGEPRATGPPPVA